MADQELLLQFGTSEILDDILPLGGLSYLPKFGFNFPLKIFRAVLFPIPLEPTRSQNLSRARSWQSMELEAVG